MSKTLTERPTLCEAYGSCTLYFPPVRNSSVCWYVQYCFCSLSLKHTTLSPKKDELVIDAEVVRLSQTKNTYNSELVFSFFSSLAVTAEMLTYVLLFWLAGCLALRLLVNNSLSRSCVFICLFICVYSCAVCWLLVMHSCPCIHWWHTCVCLTPFFAASYQSSLFHRRLHQGVSNPHPSCLCNNAIIK